jgi:hypothetical protein
MDSEVDEWTMEYTDTEGKLHSFKGNRDIRSLLIGVRNYLLKLRENGYNKMQ